MSEGDLTDLSFSRVQAYQRCPWMYHLVYNLGWRSGPTAGMALGQSIHRTLGRFLAAGATERSLERLHEIFDEEWVNEGFGSPEETVAAYESGREMLARFFEGESPRFADVVATEKDFDIPFGAGLRFRGTMDRLDRRGDGYEIVEYKTQAAPWTPSRMEADLQMTFYALGMRTVLKGAPVRLRYHFLSNGESRVVERSAEQLAEAERILSDVGARLQKKDFTPDQRYCPRCEFARRCEYYRPPDAPGDNR
jgi:RecB family exonuclease